MERRATLIIKDVHPGMIFQQRPHDWGVTLMARDEEGRPALGRLLIHGTLAFYLRHPAQHLEQNVVIPFSGTVVERCLLELN